MAPKKRVFIIDDDPDIIDISTKLLETNGYVVTSETNPKTGLRQLETNPPDLLLLDINMEEMDGLDVCRAVKSNPKIKDVPIVMISVNQSEADVVLGLELGAEDYIRKPFLTRELLARVKVVFRKHKSGPPTKTITCGPFQLDYDKYRASMDGKPLKLSPKEFELLGFFMQHEGRVLTRSTIYEGVWGVDLKGKSRTVDSHVDFLRKKLKKYRECIQGLKGVGYRFEV
jgi:DNA-binding response OmpR family regulator